MTNLPLKLAEISRATPMQEAIVYEKTRITYAQLNQEVSRLAAGLKETGIRAGDKVLLALNNSPEFIISYYAILRLGAIVIPINPQFTVNEIRVIVKDAPPSAVIAEKELMEALTQLVGEMDSCKKVILTTTEAIQHPFAPFAGVLAAGRDPVPDSVSSRDDVAVILYTAGTTGRPKGAMLTHYNLYSNAHTLSRLCNMTPRDRALLVAPAYHAGAQTCVMNNAIVSGSTLIVHPKWSGPEAVLRTIQEEKVTFMFGSPTMYSLIVNYPKTEQFDTSSWRIAYTGAAPLPREVFHLFEKKFGFQITEGYGLSEASPVVTSNPPDGPKKVGSVGKPIPGVEVKIFDYEDKEVPRGQIGEVVVRGPNVMKGYYNRDEETKWVMRNGWLHTGDLGYIDQDGFLFIVDRKKDVIIRGGININPREIEEVLSAHPKVFDVAVLGIPDAVMGEEVMALILLRSDVEADPEEFREFCQGKLAKYKIPRYFRFVDNLPKTASGKLMRKKLREWVINNMK